MIYSSDEKDRLTAEKTRPNSRGGVVSMVLSYDSDMDSSSAKIQVEPVNIRLEPCPVAT